MLQKYNMVILDLTFEHSEEIVSFTYSSVVRATPKHYCQTQEFWIHNDNKETRLLNLRVNVSIHWQWNSLLYTWKLSLKVKQTVSSPMKVANSSPEQKNGNRQACDWARKR